MNNLEAAHALLSKAMLTDTRTALANAVAWLDPTRILGMSNTDDDEYPYDPHDEEGYALSVALRICQVCFPEIYTSTSQLILYGASHQEIDRHLCNSINAHLATPIDEIIEIPYGIPLQPMGVSFWDYEFWQQPDDLHDFLMLFDITEDNADDTDQLVSAGCAAAVLKHSLEAQESDTYKKLYHLLEWVFSSSGNTAVDISPEEFYESGISPLDWTPENIALMNEMTEEAEAILREAQAGLELLLSDAELDKVFRKNIRSTRKALARNDKKKGISNDEIERCAKLIQWPACPEQRDPGAANP